MKVRRLPDHVKTVYSTQYPLNFSQSYTYTNLHKPTGHVEESPFVTIDSSDGGVARLPHGPVKLEVTKDQWSEVRPSITWNCKWLRATSQQGTAWKCISVQWFNSSESCWEIHYPYTILYIGIITGLDETTAPHGHMAPTPDRTWEYKWGAIKIN